MKTALMSRIVRATLREIATHERQKGRRAYPPIRGGAPIDNIVTVQAANVSLTAAETNITPANAANGVSFPGSGPGRVGYIGEVSLHVPSITALTAGTTVTVNVRNGTTTGGTLIASALVGTGTGQTSCGVDVTVPIPAVDNAGVRVQNVFVGAVLSAATGTANGSAANPITLTQKLFD